MMSSYKSCSLLGSGLESSDWVVGAYAEQKLYKPSEIFPNTTKWWRDSIGIDVKSSTDETP